MSYFQRIAIFIACSYFFLKVLAESGAKHSALNFVDVASVTARNPNYPKIVVEDVIRIIEPDEEKNTHETVENHDEVAKANDYLGENGKPGLSDALPGQDFAILRKHKKKEQKASVSDAIDAAIATEVNSIAPSVSYEEAAKPTSTMEEEVSSATVYPPVALATSCKAQGQVAITYSEGPSDVTAKIVRQLNNADARANFFINATWLYTQQYALVVQNTYKAGHLIGMMYRVPGDDASKLTDDELRQDILNNAHTIETVIKVAPKYVRLHYTKKRDTRTENIIQDLGFVLVGYNLDSQDYNKKDSETGSNSVQEVYSQTFKKYKDTYDTKGSFISIQYDLPYTGSLNAVPYVINTIAEEGYTMVRLDGCLKDPVPYKKSANSTEYVSDKYSFNQVEYHQGQKPIALNTANIPDTLEEFRIAAKNEENGAPTNTITMIYSVIIAVIGAARGLL
ncbi:MAG: hypothetical protein EXX96DRAFT_546141 [Benjaminiella poitrasii]|nr:MAG: hypothetical protein EXX96DRAFT_546141 [Benjaminiella poitrasii]